MRFHPEDIGDRQGDERRDRAAEARTRTNPLYFSDYCIEAGVLACHFCGTFEPEAELLRVQVDEDGNWERICGECSGTYQEEPS